ASVGNERRILVSELAGQASISAKLNQRAGTLDPSRERERPEVDRATMTAILNRVQDLENEGYEFEAAEASFDLLVRKVMGTFQPKFERLAYRVNIEVDDDGQPVTEATIKVRIGGQVQHTVSEGDGPVNALD